MAEWLVKLTGDSIDLEALAAQFTSPESDITKDGNDYWLKSSNFVGLTGADEVLALTNALLRVINGAGKVFLSGYHPIGIGHVVQICDDGIRHNSVSFTASVSFRASVVADIRDAEGNFKPQDALPKDVEFASTIAQSEELVRRALTFFNEEQNWVNLYKVYELIQEDVGKGMSTRGWTTEKQATRFRRTANSAVASGDGARHAIESEQPPPRPMPLEEAKLFVQSLLANWIRSKR